MLKLFVLLKRTFDTEEKIVVQQGEIDPGDAKYIINPYDEYAIEEALLLREKHGGEVTVVTVGSEDAETELRTALAMGCDKAVLIEYEEELDPHISAKILAAYFQDKQADLILAGNASVDHATGQVGPRTAELLHIPYVTTVTGIELNGTKVTVQRDVEGDTEVIETSLPLLVTAQQGLNEPRYPSLPGIMKTKKKPLDTLELDDIDLDEEELAKSIQKVRTFLPPEKEEGYVLQGELADQVKELVSILYHEKKVI
ncbi:electron transfer flavoprotein subunit beta/FixA family protein [Neobacillus mesonae]|uniref:Electron transfer flavoprotein subunit beta n=1 Tax=Neobacillus mesonae TaxID=1193713 RepID=A0A3T0I4U9_9BACI|nr:electron transfer flavoprotein subunit beta/FixA family protein [Neobacillus mesonae]AZU64351.1 electron transfer flavoprotein subunit beta [Neobacillus mesonae]